MKRMILPAICLGAVTFLTACDSSQENPELTSVGVPKHDAVEDPFDEQSSAGRDLDDPTAGLTGPLTDA